MFVEWVRPANRLSTRRAMEVENVAERFAYGEKPETIKENVRASIRVRIKCLGLEGRELVLALKQEGWPLAAIQEVMGE